MLGQEEIVLSLGLLADLLTTLQSKKHKTKQIIQTLAKVVVNVNILLEGFHMEPLEYEDIEDFAINTIPAEVQVDAVLNIMEMMSALIDITYYVNVTLGKPIWAEEEVPEEVEQDFITVYACMFNLGRKFKFKYEDIADEIYRVK